MAIINFFVGINMIIMCIVFSLIGIVVALFTICCIDYLFDLDIKGWLSTHFKRPSNLVKKIEEVTEEIDQKCREEQIRTGRD